MDQQRVFIYNYHMMREQLTVDNLEGSHNQFFNHVYINKSFHGDHNIFHDEVFVTSQVKLKGILLFL
jgi:hypothetical protein